MSGRDFGIVCSSVIFKISFEFGYFKTAQRVSYLDISSHFQRYNINGRTIRNPEGAAISRAARNEYLSKVDINFKKNYLKMLVLKIDLNKERLPFLLI